VCVCVCVTHMSIPVMVSGTLNTTKRYAFLLIYKDINRTIHNCGMICTRNKACDMDGNDKLN